MIPYTRPRSFASPARTHDTKRKRRRNEADFPVRGLLAHSLPQTSDITRLLDLYPGPAGRPAGRPVHRCGGSPPGVAGSTAAAPVDRPGGWPGRGQKSSSQVLTRRDGFVENTPESPRSLCCKIGILDVRGTPNVGKIWNKCAKKAFQHK